MFQHLISLLIATPLVAAGIILLLPSGKRYQFATALSVSVIQLAILVLIFQTYDTGITTLQLVEKYSWITLRAGAWGVLQSNYFVALDGLSLPLIALSVAVMAIAVGASYSIDRNRKGYFSLLLLLNAAIMGTFTAHDFLLFYLFFEFMLLPMFFLIGIWGGSRREYASIKFFLYTLAGSILILIVLIALYISTKTPGAHELIHSFSFADMQRDDNIILGSILDKNRNVMIAGLSVRSWAFLLLFIGFAIKLPAVPLHTWLPDAHVEAPTPVSVLLAAILLKIGGYGLLRIAYPIFPDTAQSMSSLVAITGVVSILYGALNAMASKDLKRLIAYSSVSHMGFVLVGLASSTTEGIAGAIYQMVSHGIISAMLFLIAGVLYDRTHDRLIGNYSGLAAKMPQYFSFTLIAFFAALGLPGFSGFMAEIFVLLGAFKAAGTGFLHQSLPILASLGLIIGAAYCLWAIQRMFMGTYHVKNESWNSLLTDLSFREKIVLIPLALATLIFGIFPDLLLSIINPFAENMLALMTGTSSH
jgi:NADH-quinone oxidoreductase subunit M